MMFRMGINLGDVIVQGDDVFGDGVTATLWELADMVKVLEAWEAYKDA